MGADFSAYLIFGMPVSEEDFWRPAGNKTMCRNGHEQSSPDMQFCPTCGKKFEAADLVEPTQVLEKYAIDNGFEDHDEAWEHLIDGPDEGPSILCADSFQGSESTPSQRVLGFRLMDIDEYGRDAPPIYWEELGNHRATIRKAAEAMGLEWKEPILSSVLYCSY